MILLLAREMTKCGYDQNERTSFCRLLANTGIHEDGACIYAHFVGTCALKDAALKIMIIDNI